MLDMDSLENSLNLKKSVEELEENIEQFKRYLEWRSKMQKFYYDSLMEKGFDKEDALVIISHFIDGKG